MMAEAVDSEAAEKPDGLSGLNKGAEWVGEGTLSKVSSFVGDLEPGKLKNPNKTYQNQFNSSTIESKSRTRLGFGSKLLNRNTEVDFGLSRIQRLNRRAGCG